MTARSTPDGPEEAKRAAHDTYCSEPDCDHQYDEVLGNILAAAAPHLHRAWLEALIARLDALPGLGWIGYKAWTRDFLRAELEEGDGE